MTDLAILGGRFRAALNDLAPDRTAHRVFTMLMCECDEANVADLDPAEIGEACGLQPGYVRVVLGRLRDRGFIAFAPRGKRTAYVVDPSVIWKGAPGAQAACAFAPPAPRRAPEPVLRLPSFVRGR